MLALAIIIVALILLLIMPVGVFASYFGGELLVKAKIGFLRVTVFPAKTAKTKKPKKEKKPKAEKTEEKKAEHTLKKLTLEDIFAIAKIGLKALSRFRRSISIDKFVLHLIVSSEDPYDAVMQYGYVNAAICALAPLMHSAFKIREEDVSVDVDVQAGKMNADALLEASIQIWEILYIALCTGFALLAWNRQRKKRAKAKMAAEIQSEKGR